MTRVVVGSRPRPGSGSVKSGKYAGHAYRAVCRHGAVLVSALRINHPPAMRLWNVQASCTHLTVPSSPHVKKMCDEASVAMRLTRSVWQR